MKQNSPKQITVWTTLIYGNVAALENLFDSIDRRLFDARWANNAQSIKIGAMEKETLLGIVPEVKNRLSNMGEIKQFVVDPNWANVFL
jgi:hypothetical protein